ncbi:MAG TPA: DUF58 domain-containing protein [Planctomicrobium sp.]|nr:DUF58 domain-containing protein [Planctomicrobium sp.]
MSSAGLNFSAFWIGIFLMIFGLGLVNWELQTGMFHERVGPAGYAMIMALGTACSVWGLKELVAQIWPRFAARGYYFRIPREGIAYLIMTFFFFAGSILAHSNLLLMVFSLMVGAFMINGWLTFTLLQGAVPRRKVPERTMAGEPVGVEVELENRVLWVSARLMTVHDRVAHDSGELEPDILFVQVLPRKKTFGQYQFRPARRGRYEFSQIDVTTRFPLGLVQRGVSREQPQQLLVYPRIGHLQSSWRQQSQNSDEMATEVRGATGVFQDEFRQLREYRVGDDRRMIHWRTSARLNELMVCEYQEVRDRDLFLIFDAWLPENPTPQQSEELERGLSFVTTAAMDALHANRHSSLFVELLGRHHFSWRGDVDRDPDLLLDELAVLEPHQEESLETMRLLIAGGRHRPRRIVIISTRQEVVREVVYDWPDGLPPEVEFIGTGQESLNQFFVDADDD